VVNRVALIDPVRKVSAAGGRWASRRPKRGRGWLAPVVAAERFDELRDFELPTVRAAGQGGTIGMRGSALARRTRPAARDEPKGKER